MLVNYTNHKSSDWQKEQYEEAIKLYGEIVDIPFQNVPPDYNEQQVIELGKQELDKILEHKPTAVHIQGEFTLTFYLVANLLKNNIKCIASTTNREVEEIEPGKIVHKFKFVRFREYVI